MDWFEDHGYGLPGNWMPAPPPIRTPPTPPRTRFSPGNLRVACKRPRLPAIDERDDIGYGGGTASTEPPRPPTPPRPRRHQSNHEEVMETLRTLGGLLDDQNEQARYESRGFRSAVRRQRKKLCNRYNLQYPSWLDGTGMSVKQFKNRVRWFMEDFVVQQAHQPRPRNATFKSPKSPKSPSGDGLKKALPTSDGTDCAPGDNSSNSSSSSPMNVECPGNPPPATGMEVPSGTVAPADERPSSAVVISHMMDNLLDDLDKLHPGARQKPSKVSVKVCLQKAQLQSCFLKGLQLQGCLLQAQGCLKKAQLAHQGCLHKAQLWTQRWKTPKSWTQWVGLKKACRCSRENMCLDLAWFAKRVHFVLPLWLVFGMFNPKGMVHICFFQFTTH